MADNRSKTIPKTLGVVMDPIAQIRPEKDTTLGLLEAAQRKGWALVYFEQDDLYLRDGVAHGNGRELKVSLDVNHWFHLGEPRDIAFADLDVVLMRKDPPLDLEFMYSCCVLEHAMRAGTLVVNNPHSVRMNNEKLFAQQFADLGPPTLVSRNQQRIMHFLEEYDDTVIKPLDNMGGASVFRLRKGDQNAAVTIEMVTHNGHRTVMVQGLIENYEKGDKRILIVDGEPVPFALTRIPPPGQLRANLAAGGRGEVCELNERDREICARLAPALSDAGLLFVGLDVIGGYLTEVNVSSPTCMRELNTACSLDIGMQLMDAIASRLSSTHTSRKTPCSTSVTGTVMGFDFGLARIGVAVGNLDSGHAEALTTLHAKNGQPDWNKIKKLVADWQPTTFVLGNPCADDAAQTPNPSSLKFSKKLLQFQEELQTQFNLPTELADESYTSTEARQLLKEQRRTGRLKKIRKDEIDMTAATLILQSWLSQTQASRA